jgi:hypothetical protein
LAVGEGDHRVRFKGSCWSLTGKTKVASPMNDSTHQCAIEKVVNRPQGAQ